jgi:PAS domain S-box-containing protein
VARAYGIESLEDDPELLAIIRFAAHLCQTEVALISWLDGDLQRFVARHGIAVRQTPRTLSFFARTMTKGDAAVVNDLSQDPDLAGHPLVTGTEHVRFYAGQPLISSEGAPLGALSVVDRKPRPEGLTDLQREGLQLLAGAVMQRLRTHRLALAARRELDASEAYLHILADSIPAIAWSATPEGHFDYFNQRMVDFTGLPDDQSGSAFHPEDWKKASAKWQHSLRTGEIYEVEHRLCRHDGEYRWMISRALPVRDGDGKILRWFGTAVDIHDIYEASESRELLAQELSHRIKNIFAVIGSLISMSARQAPEHKDFAGRMRQRIGALGRAHEFVRPHSDESRKPGIDTTFHALVAEILSPYPAHDGGRIEIGGEDEAVDDRSATPLALLIHELATNATKYGSLSNESGCVRITTHVEGDDFVVDWSEVGGPPVAGPPERTGFGTDLTEISIRDQLGGDLQREWAAEGLRVTVRVPCRNLRRRALSAE